MFMPQHNKVLEETCGLAFAQTGRGSDVVLIHGALTCLDDMAIALFASLKDEFRVTAFDRPGHGQNRSCFTGTPGLQAQAIHACVRSLGLVRPVLVGHSFGGAVALAYAQRFADDVAGVVALSPIAFPEPRLEHLLFAPRAIPGPLGLWNHALARLIDPVLLPILWRAMFLPQAIPARFAEAFPFKSAGRPGQLYAEAQDAALLAPGVAWNTAGYGACHVPTHILAGDRDLVVNTAFHASGLARSLPRARLTTLRGLGHMIHHFAQPPIVEAVRTLHAAA